MNITSSNPFQIDNLKINKCQAQRGGAIYFSNSEGIISYSEFNNNEAQITGGGIFLDNGCQIRLYDSKVLHNSTKEHAGGGIYAEGYININGNTLISGNSAGSTGGGIIFLKKSRIKYCIICNNKAEGAGGGIRNKGNLFLEDGKIYSNWSNDHGGGISNVSTFTYDKDKINNIVYDNIAEKGGNNIYPEIK